MRRCWHLSYITLLPTLKPITTQTVPLQCNVHVSASVNERAAKCNNYTSGQYWMPIAERLGLCVLVFFTFVHGSCHGLTIEMSNTWAIIRWKNDYLCMRTIKLILECSRQSCKPAKWHTLSVFNGNLHSHVGQHHMGLLFFSFVCMCL